MTATLAKEEPTRRPGDSDVDAVHLRVREAILRGELSPGTEVSQVKLAESLGVSRTPLREALRLLQREGLVDTAPNRKVRIASISVGDLEQICATRIVVECLALRGSTHQLTPDHYGRLEGDLAQMRHFAQTRDHTRWEIVHRRFHQLPVAHAGARLVGLLDDLGDHAQRYRTLVRQETSQAWATAATEHRGILDALQSGDHERIVTSIVRHRVRTAMSVIALTDPTHVPDLLRAAVESVGVEWVDQ